jgi:hypothetical protein
MLESDSIPLGKKFILAPMGSSPAMTKESDLDFFKRSPSNRDVISMT